MAARAKGLSVRAQLNGKTSSSAGIKKRLQTPKDL